MRAKNSVGRACVAALVWATGIGASDLALAGPMSANNFQIPSKDVILSCAPLRYRVDCSISMRANPQYSTYCFYVSNGGSYPMKTDYRFGFFNDIVDLRLRDGMRISAELTERATGRRANCTQVGIAH